MRLRVMIRLEHNSQASDFCECDGFGDFENLVDFIVKDGFVDSESKDEYKLFGTRLVFDSENGYHFAEIILEKI